MSSIVNTAGEVAALVAERVARISVANGYETDIGQKVFRGKRRVADEQIGTGCVDIIEGVDMVDDRVGGRLAQCAISQRYGLVAYLPCDPDAPNDAAHAAIRDLKRAIFDKDATLGGSVKGVRYMGRDIGARADGASFVIAVVEIAVEYVENLISP